MGEKEGPLIIVHSSRIPFNVLDGCLARKLLSCAKPFSSTSAPTKIPPAERRHEKFAVAI